VCLTAEFGRKLASAEVTGFEIRLALGLSPIKWGMLHVQRGTGGRVVTFLESSGWLMVISAYWNLNLVDDR
jgi:hypothetical protein